MTQTSVYVGNNPADLAAYTSWMGIAPDDVLFYLNDWSWKDFDSSIGWAVNLWKPINVPVIWSVPLTVTGTYLEQVATGAYNNYFLKAAQALAQSKPSSDGNIYVRVGWEFNGSWMPWSAEGHESAFIQSFQNLVNTFRSVSTHFKFVWDVNAGGSYDPAKAYPGDKYVDVVGMDLYYTTQWDSADPHTAFLNKVKQSYGLQWQQDFASAHGKATAISEWGIESNNAGPYIQEMVKWIKDHQMIYENYWDTGMANYPGTIHNNQYANASAIYKSTILDLQSADNSSVVAFNPVTPSISPSTSIIASADTHQVATPALEFDGQAVFRFFDTKTGDHFYTTSAAEKAQILAAIPSFNYEGSPWSVPVASTETHDVFRFYDTKTGTHFFTDSASERDTIISTIPNYKFEGVAFAAYNNEGGEGHLTLERFYNTNTGLHHYAGSAEEAESINKGHQGPGWVDEGRAFTVHAAVDSLVFV